jgi:hypothetical protein
MDNNSTVLSKNESAAKPGVPKHQRRKPRLQWKTEIEQVLIKLIMEFGVDDWRLVSREL